ncbi:hypothetical protein Cgig2_026627 [Carnegiea gigantea]|uniref:Uncharacterized protein n=2 Tax=Carnegiea gigantea TaxID=171969 RepID=A0A9Q1JX52_9CARY|nr:hypothetical protein Cgig2_026627 [Carnegiea gigantea]
MCSANGFEWKHSAAEKSCSPDNNAAVKILPHSRRGMINRLWRRRPQSYRSKISDGEHVIIPGSYASPPDASGSSPPVSTSASTPPPTHSAAVQNSVPMSPQPIALFRQPFPANYIPYSHYYSPFYVPPTVHQYFGHTAFPPPLPTGNVYLTPPAAAAGMKISPAPYKLGANTGNHVPAGLPPGYGTCSSLQVPVSPNVAVTSGNSSSTEDLMPSALKENNVYAVQQNEGPAVWLPAGGRDTASFPLNSLMNVPPHGQPVISPQSPPGAFAVYHALQPMASLGPGLTLLSQPMAGSTEPVAVGPASNSYQQQHPQRQQQPMNWNV